MKNADSLVNNVWRVSADIGMSELFEGMWSLPHGVMINSYLIKGETKTVLVDLVKDWDGSCDSYEHQFNQLEVKPEDIDILVLNHMEPDHTGDIARFFEKNPKVELYCTAKAAPLISEFYGVNERIHTIADGEILDLGGKRLQFFITPNVHWPETMMSYLIEDEILFSCDAFGSYGVFNSCFYDQLDEKEREIYATELERYYASIVSTFSPFVNRAIKKLTDAGLPVSVVAPSHGVVWRQDCGEILGWYDRIASYLKGPREKEITLIWGSMYGNTAELIDVVKAAAESEGVPLHVLQVPNTNASVILEKAWRSEGIVLGMPTYQYRMFPPMYTVLDEFDRHKVNGRKMIRFGSFGWSGGAQKYMDEYVKTLKADYMGTVEFQGKASEEDKKNLYDLVVKMASSIKEG